MKFSHSLQFNAVPEWTSKYIAYTTLKKLIYLLQRDSLRNHDRDLESTYLAHLEHSDRPDGSTVFLAALDVELKKIDEFYKATESFAYHNTEELVRDIEHFEAELEGASKRRSSSFSELGLSRSRSKLQASRERTESDASGELHLATTDPDTEFTEGEDGREDDELVQDYDPEERPMLKTKTLQSRNIEEYLKSPKTAAIWGEVTNQLPPQLMLLSESRVILRKRVIGSYTTLSELKSYIELNHTGFKKALKKFDKSLNTNLKDDYLKGLSTRSYIFQPSTSEKLNEHLDSLVRLYALICNHGDDYEAARSELSIHLREHVIWERNTVWRDMIGLERKAQAPRADGSDKKMSAQSAMNFEFSMKNPTLVKISLICFLTIILLTISPFGDKEQKNCFALLICASLLWATEAIPLFVTSLLIPLLIIVFKVLKNDDGSVMNALDGSKYILSTMWNSVILLLLGGFTLAAALSKYHIAKVMSTWILSKAGTNPSTVLLTIMGVALFASMWISNVAAPVLCFSLIQPLLRTLPKDSQFIKALILGIALASNVGGMASPIASPQNMIAIGAMNPQPSWGQWFVIALPVCIIALVLIWLFLLLAFRCNSKNTTLVSIRTIDDKFTLTQWYIIAITILTILLWCVASRLETTFGEMGIIALIPMVLFFGPGLLVTEDFNNYPWNIVILAMGGTALGKAVASSGLLSTIAQTIQAEVEDLSLFGVTLTFGLLILTMATFVSHTVAALIIIPLVSEIGNKLPEPHPRLLIMASALLCSAAMGLPTSGFPNVTAICMTDEFGKPYLTVGTFITRGVPSSIIAYVVIVTVGYVTMRIINF